MSGDGFCHQRRERQLDTAYFPYPLPHARTSLQAHARLKLNAGSISVVFNMHAKFGNPQRREGEKEGK
jgi:hypothetical protein